MRNQVVRVRRDQGLTESTKTTVRYICRSADDLVAAVTTRLFNILYGNGESVLDRDWDNLLLYDACRYDEFLKIAPVPNSDVRKRVTVGSQTPEFLRRTFDGKTCHDTEYVTANPQPLKYAVERDDTPFHAIISLLKYWDEETQPIHPEDVFEAVVSAAEDYPDKRLIVHFLQPHAPFLGETAGQIREQTGKTIGGLDPGREYTNVESQSIETTSYPGMLRSHPEVTISDIRDAYRETLAITTNYVFDLAEKLDGKSVITSDHGELLGERLHPLGIRRWEHPEGIRSSELCFVPWVEYPWDARKSIISEPPAQQSNINEQRVNNRLQSLGYIE